MSRRAAIVGDIHGCLAEAEQLLEELRRRGLRYEDELILLGDLVDKGPDALGVVQFFGRQRELGQRTVLLLGNHEQRHARWRAAVRREAAGGKANTMKDEGGVLQGLNDALTDADEAFLDSATLWHEIPWAGALVVHAGLLPEMLPDPSNLPDLGALDGLSRKQRERLQRVVRLRYWRPSAAERGFVPMGSEAPGDTYWAELYDGRFGHIYFGHEPFVDADGPVAFPHATALDLGAVHGNRLAAMLLEGDARVPVVVRASREWHVSRGGGVGGAGGGA
jgi:serine/threonine protein phosphatase 1